MAFQRVSNTNTYAPSMRGLSDLNPTALSGLLDRADSDSSGTSSSPTMKPFVASAAPYAGSPTAIFSTERPSPEARQSVWQYPPSAIAAASPVTRSLVTDPIPETQEMIPAPVPPPAETEEQASVRQAQFGGVPTYTVPMPELERIQYMNVAPVMPRRLV